MNVAVLKDYRKEEYDFPVTEKAIQVCGGKKIHRKKAIVREDTDDVLAIVSSKYKIVMNNEIISSFEEALATLTKTSPKFNNYTVVTELPMNGARLYRKYVFNDITATIDNTEINLSLELVNSYDGSVSVGFFYGGRSKNNVSLVMGAKFETIIQKHFESVNVDSMVGTLENTINIFLQYIDMWGQWTKIPMTIEKVGDTVEGNKKLSDKMKAAIIQRFAEDEKQSKWGFFHAVMYCVANCTNSRKQENLRAKQIDTESIVANIFY